MNASAKRGLLDNPHTHTTKLSAICSMWSLISCNTLCASGCIDIGYLGGSCSERQANGKYIIFTGLQLVKDAKGRLP
jgi:hypothetical protein